MSALGGLTGHRPSGGVTSVRDQHLSFRDGRRRPATV